MTYHKETVFIKAIQYIYKHIDEPIELQKLSTEIGVSVATLKRLFLETTEKSVGSFIRKLRMELSFRNINKQNESILESALRVGFDDHSAFTRCFKKTFGYTPSEARKKLNIVSELEAVELEEPEIITLNDINLQACTAQGLYFEAAPNAWKTLKLALKNQLNDDFSGAFIGVGHDNPHEGIVPENKVRFSAGVTFINNELGAEKLTLSGGRYARFHFNGKPNNLGLAYHYIYGKWADSISDQISDSKSAFIIFDSIPEAEKNSLALIHVPIETL